MFFVLLPMLLWGRVKISEHASAAARACCNYSIPGVKHITEQITEISFNFDVQFVQAAPRPGIWNVEYLNQEKLKITIFSFHDPVSPYRTNEH